MTKKIGASKIKSSDYYMKKSVRVGPTKVSSFNIPKAVLSLYSAVLCEDGMDPVQFSLDAVDRITDSMVFETAKGLSPAVCAELLQEIAFQNNFKKEFKKMMRAL